MSTRRSWFWPLNSLFVVLPSAAIFAVVLARTWEMLSWPYPVWVQASAHWHQQFVFAGPIAAAMACLWAVRLGGADRIWAQPQAPRMGSGVVARHLRLLLGWFVGSYVAALLPLTITTAVNGAIGAPQPGVMASGVLAMSAATAVGYVVGTLVRSLAVVPLVAVIFYGLDAFAAYGTDTFGAVIPQLYTDPVVGLAESTELVVFRLAFFFVVTAVSVALAATVLRSHSTGRHQSRLVRVGDVALYATAPVVLIVTALITTPHLFQIEASADERICRTVDGIEYCVHEDNTPRLDQMITEFGHVLHRYGTTPTQFDGVRDHTLLLHTPMNGQPIDGALVARLEPDGSVDTLSSGLIPSLIGITRCAGSLPGEVETLYGNLADYLSTGRPIGVFNGMRPDEIRAWIHQHRDQLDDCTLQPQDLPRR